MPDVVVDFSTQNADKPARAVELTTAALRTASKAAYDVFTAAGRVDTTFSKWSHGARQSIGLLRQDLSAFASELAGVKLPSFNGGIGGFIAESAAMGIDIARQEEQRKRNQQEATRVAALGVAERRREVISNLADDDFINASNIDAVSSRIASSSSTPLNKVQGALVPSLSAAGALSNEHVERALTMAFQMMPGNEGFAANFAPRMLDLANVEQAAGREVNYEVLAGSIMSAQAASRVKSQEKLMQTAVPLAKAMSGTGTSTERSFEYFAGMSNVLADQEGDKTRTMVASLDSHLADTQRNMPELSKKLKGVSASDISAFSNAKNLDERLAALHSSPALFNALDKADQFNFGEADTKTAIRGLLTGDKSIMGQIDAAAGKVVWGDQASSFFSKKMGDMAAGPHQGILSAEQGSAANIEAGETGQTLAQRNAAMRKLVGATRGKTGENYFRRKQDEFSDWVNWDEDRPEITARNSLQQQRIMAGRRRRDATTDIDREKADSDAALIDKQLELIGGLIDALNKNSDATKQNTTANGGVEQPPSEPQTAGLAR